MLCPPRTVLPGPPTPPTGLARENAPPRAHTAALHVQPAAPLDGSQQPRRSERGSYAAHLRARGSPWGRYRWSAAENARAGRAVRRGQSSPVGRVEHTAAVARQQLPSDRLHIRAHRQPLGARCSGSPGHSRRVGGAALTWDENAASPRTPPRWADVVWESSKYGQLPDGLRRCDRRATGTDK